MRLDEALIGDSKLRVFRKLVTVVGESLIQQRGGGWCFWYLIM